MAGPRISNEVSVVRQSRGQQYGSQILAKEPSAQQARNPLIGFGEQGKK